MILGELSRKGGSFAFWVGKKQLPPLWHVGKVAGGRVGCVGCVGCVAGCWLCVCGWLLAVCVCVCMCVCG